MLPWFVMRHTQLAGSAVFVDAAAQEEALFEPGELKVVLAGGCVAEFPACLGKLGATELRHLGPTRPAQDVEQGLRRFVEIFAAVPLRDRRRLVEILAAVRQRELAEVDDARGLFKRRRGGGLRGGLFGGLSFGAAGSTTAGVDARGAAGTAASGPAPLGALGASAWPQPASTRTNPADQVCQRFRVCMIPSPAGCHGRRFGRSLYPITAERSSARRVRSHRLAPALGQLQPVNHEPPPVRNQVRFSRDP